MVYPSEKLNPKPLEYGRPQPSNRQRLTVLGIALALGVLLLWGLFELQRMPYATPRHEHPSVW
jgi:hypothetical protein